MAKSSHGGTGILWKPIVNVVGANGDQTFVKLVTGILDSLPYESEELFPRAYRTLYAVHKEKGFNAVVDILEMATSSPTKRDLSLRSYGTHLGELVLHRMSDKDKERFLPFNDLDIEPRDRSFEVVIRSLSTKRANGEPLMWDGEPCFYSPRKPTVAINGVGKIVAFSKHAVEQICERACTAWKTYGGLGDAFAYFADCQYFELCEIRGRRGNEGPQLAISFFQDCFLDYYRADVITPPSEYFMRIIGPHPEHLNKHWYYRVGYCPIEMKAEFVIATTLLPPGYSKTPEYTLLERSALSGAQKSAMLKRATNNSYEYVIKTFDYDLAKWYHDNGIPQVCTLPDDVFAQLEGRLARLAPIDSPTSDFSKLRDMNKTDAD